MTKRRSSSPTSSSATRASSSDASDLVRTFAGLPRSVQILVLIVIAIVGILLVRNPDLLNGLIGAAPTPTAPHATSRPATAQPATARPTTTDAPVASNPTTQPGGDSFSVRYPAMPQGLTRAEVVRVVDGDTVRINLDGIEETVRLIGLNTPETVAPNRPVECFGREASARAHELLDNQTVYFETDETQDTRDRYGRLLGYVWLGDGRLFNMQMIAEGYAYEYTYSIPYKYQSQFKAAQRDAEAENRGLWSPSTCNGQK